MQCKETLALPIFVYCDFCPMAMKMLRAISFPSGAEQSQVPAGAINVNGR